MTAVQEANIYEWLRYLGGEPIIYKKTETLYLHISLLLIFFKANICFCPFIHLSLHCGTRIGIQIIFLYIHFTHSLVQKNQASTWTLEN